MRLLLIATVGDTLRAFYLPIAAHLRRAGWRVDGLARDIESCEQCRETFHEVWEAPLSRKPLDPRNLTTAARRIAQVVAANDYDVVHVCTPVAAFVTRFALRGLRKSGKPKVIYTAHGFHFYRGGNPLRNAIYLGLERLAGRWTDCLAVINEHDRSMAEQHSLVPNGQLVYIPGAGIDCSRFQASQVPEAAVAAVRRALAVAEDAPLFLMVAEFNRNKRQDDAIRALAGMRCRRAQLVFAGDGPTFEKAKRLAAELGVEDRVHFPGVRRDIPQLARASVAMVLPSRREGLPRSVMESLALGVPVIGSDIRGTRDLVGDGCGVLVKAGDVEGFSRAMDWMVEHPDEARAMGARGCARMKQYDVRTIIALHEELYERMAPAARVAVS